MFRTAFALLLLLILLSGVNLVIAGAPQTGLLVLCGLLGLMAIPLAFVAYPLGFLILISAVGGAYWVDQAFVGN